MRKQNIINSFIGGECKKLKYFLLHSVLDNSSPSKPKETKSKSQTKTTTQLSVQIVKN